LIERSINPAQLLIFLKFIKVVGQAWAGRPPAPWVASLNIPSPSTEHLSEQPLSRSQLINLWRDKSVSTEVCFLSTMAWGGMRVNNGRLIWSAKDVWLPICERLRAGELQNREEAYETFRSLRLSNELPGMGPAYFTKILFFARPTQNAYILDQWTARSIHVLTLNRTWPKVLVDSISLKRMTAQGGSARHIRATVSDHVTSSDYERYCRLVEKIALTAGMAPFEVEEHMFGEGGRHPTAWRSYVMENWYALNSN